MPVELSGPWSQATTDTFLDECTLPLRLSCIASDGFPRVASMWFRFDAGHLLCVTHQNSKVAKILKQNNRVGFEVSPNEPPYYGVRGQGLVSIEKLGDSPLLEDLLARYVGDTSSSFAQWLLGRKEEELILSIKPQRLFTWDYRERMP
ncbi:MAG: pyridoxamine 5'-phosphate oxidase family protein [Pseudomonadales bacterium]